MKILKKLGLMTIKEHEKDIRDISHKIYDQCQSDLKIKQEENELYVKDNLKLMDKVKELHQEKTLLESGISNMRAINEENLNNIKKLKREITSLNNELTMLHEKYDGKFIVEKLPPAKLSKTQIMKVNHRNSVRSRIARDSVIDAERE